VADALQAAHELGIVHRDLKPDNIMLARGRTGADVVKVVDFGIAKAIGGDDSQRVTRTGLVVGTPEFMSPEQLAGDKVDGRTDIYALALVLYKMLTGKLPFEASTVQETMVKRLTDDPLTLAEARPTLSYPAGLQAALDVALARDPTERYQSAAKFASDVSAVMGLGRGAGAAAPMPATRADADGKTQLLAPSQPTAAKRRPVLPLALGALVLVGAGGAYALLGRRGDTRTPVAAGVEAPPAEALPSTTPARPIVTDARAPAQPAIPVAAQLNDLFDRIDALDGVTLRDSAKAVFDTPGVAPKDRALAAYLVANAYAKLDDRARGCEWARRAAGLDAVVRSYAALVRSLCEP
jgi:serine/threonine-protein kinase